MLPTQLSIHTMYNSMAVHELVGLCEERYVTLALFTGVENAGKLRSLATSGALQASLLEPTLVCTYL